MATKHEHKFLDCGYDEQQCDSACRAESHLCSVCGLNREQAAKEPTEIRAHVESSVQNIIVSLIESAQLRTLADTVRVIKKCSQELDWLSREQLVEMAVGNEQRNYNPFEPEETREQQDARVGQMIRDNADKRRR